MEEERRERGAYSLAQESKEYALGEGSINRKEKIKGKWGEENRGRDVNRRHRYRQDKKEDHSL